MDERYLSQIEQSRTSTKPLPLEVIENVQEAIWSGISASVKAVLHRLVDLALADEATERVGTGRHERTAERRAHRNGTYTRVWDAEGLATAAGELLGRAKVSDVVDAAVVAGAARRGDVVLTSDPRDLRRLAAVAVGGVEVIRL